MRILDEGEEVGERDEEATGEAAAAAGEEVIIEGDKETCGTGAT